MTVFDEFLEIFIGGLGFCLLLAGLWAFFLRKKKDNLLASALLLYGIAIVPRMIWHDNETIKAASLVLRLIGVVLLLKVIMREKQAAKERRG